MIRTRKKPAKRLLPDNNAFNKYPVFDTGEMRYTDTKCMMPEKPVKNGRNSEKGAE